MNMTDAFKSKKSDNHFSFSTAIFILGCFKPIFIFISIIIVHNVH